jgi:F0F1-type ATP synthase delta subunit
LKAKYSDLFKEIINAYYEGHLDNKLESILSDPSVNKEDLSRVISSFCGVQVSYSDNYINDLKDAIKSYEILHKVVNKIKTDELAELPILNGDIMGELNKEVKDIASFAGKVAGKAFKFFHK